MGESGELHVLLVEPNSSDRSGYVATLARCLPGSTIEAVSSAEDALLLVRLHDFEVLVTESRLPHLSGVDLLHFVRRYAPDTLRVLTTAAHQAGLLRQVQATSEPHMILLKTKPADHMWEELRAFLESRRLLDGASGDGSARGVSQVGRAPGY